MKASLQRVWSEIGIPADYATARGMPLQREAKRLVSIGLAADDGRRLKLTPRAAAAWRKMRVAAAHDGCILLPISGFRSIARQTRLIRAKLANGQRIAGILRFVAAPGCSEHHTGRALDLASPVDLRLDRAFARTPEFRWLKKNAARFGFRLSYPARNPHRIGYEPWHWSFVGHQ